MGLVQRHTCRTGLQAQVSQDGCTSCLLCPHMAWQPAACHPAHMQALHVPLLLLRLLVLWLRCHMWRAHKQQRQLQPPLSVRLWAQQQQVLERQRAMQEAQRQGLSARSSQAILPHLHPHLLAPRAAQACSRAAIHQVQKPQ